MTLSGGLAGSSATQADPGSTAASAVTISTVTQVLKDVVEGAFMPLWIRGEVSDFKRHRNGHWYFTLRDGSAQLRCVAWSRDQKKIPAPPDDGMQVSAFGQLTVYAARGDVQFSVRLLEAEGDGLWRKALELTRARLEADGLLAPERKRVLPPSPRRIAVITSPDGAALHDVIHVVRKRCPSVEIVVIPAKVQGDGSAEELCAAVARLARWKEADVAIIGRGGGGREDLWSFNDESLARAVAACPIPIISAVGHEVDFTICDLVADYRAATPSAAAGAAVPDVAGLIDRLRSLRGQLRRSIQFALRSREEVLSDLRQLLPAVSARQLQSRGLRLQSLASRMNDLSPLGVMARGFSIASGSEGRTLKSVADFSEGMPFVLHLRDGAVDASTVAISPGRNGGKNGVV